MNFYRWILFPLLCAILLTFTLSLSFLIAGIPLVGLGLLTGFVFGAVMGLILQFYNEYQTKQIKPQASENDFGVNQSRQFVLFCGYAEAFDMCLNSMDKKLKAVLKTSDIASGTIEANTKMTLNSFGSTIHYKVKKVTENTTEIEVSTMPRIPSTLIDFGEGLKIIKKLEMFFESETEKRRHLLLEEKSEIPLEIYAKNVRIDSD